MKSMQQRWLPSLALAFGLAMAAVPAVRAQTLASKVEALGQMRWLDISDLRAARRDNLLHIQMEVANTSSGNETLHYRLKWKDADGFEVWGEEPWKTATIYGKQKTHIQAVAPTPKATDFVIEVQSPNNNSWFSNGNSALPASNTP